MATKVVVEGTGSWVGLKRGERQTGLLTPRVQARIDRGYVREIDRFDIPDYDAGGALPKTTVEPGRVLSPQQTSEIEPLVDTLGEGPQELAVKSDAAEPPPETADRAPVKPRRGRGKTTDG